MIPGARVVLAVAAVMAAALVGATSAAAQEPPQPQPVDASGRRWPVPVPEGCTVPSLPGVVFVGTIVDADFQTARFQIDQVRAGDIQPYAYGGLVDVRYGTDSKFLRRGSQYLVGASADPEVTNVLFSRVREFEPLFAGDDVIGVAESDVTCPQLSDPVRTLDVDGTAVDSGVFGPLADARSDLLRAILLPVGVAMAIVAGIAVVRWVLTGVGRGIGSVAHTASQTREVRSATRRDA